MIETARLTLRAWKEGDHTAYAAMNADPRVREFFPSTLSPEQCETEIRHFEETHARDGFCFFAAELRESGDFIGFIGIQTMSFAIPGLEQPAVEIGWRLAHGFWGKGLATEGARAVLDHGFIEQKLPRIVAITVPANVRSRPVMEKIGLKHLPELDFYHPRVAEGHPLRRHVLYALDNPRITHAA